MDPFWIKGPRSLAFIITRPMTSRDLVRSKSRMIARTALLSCMLLVLGLILEISLTGSMANVADLWRRFSGRNSGWRWPVIVALAASLLPTLVWALATQMLPFALTGRNWISAAAVFLSVVGFCAATGLDAWSPSGWNESKFALLIAIAPWFFTAVMVAKIAAACWATWECLRRRLMTIRDGVGIVAIWVCIAFMAITFVFLTLPLNVPPHTRTVACMAAVLLVPLGRFPLSILALEWNRHR
jgi:hypothetical protein